MLVHLRWRQLRLLHLSFNAKCVEGGVRMLLQSLVGQQGGRDALLAFLLMPRTSTSLHLRRKPSLRRRLAPRGLLVENRVVNQGRMAPRPKNCLIFRLSLRPSLNFIHYPRGQTPTLFRISRTTTSPTMQFPSRNRILVGYSFKRDIRMLSTTFPSIALMSGSTSR